jgi:hypothetical protein
MFATAKHRLTDQQRTDRRRAERELVRQSIENLRTSAGWRQWLATRARFRSYSLRNTLLIASQHPTATRVAGFKAWLALGYRVTKGQRSIRIWAPCPPSKRTLECWEQSGADPASKPRTGWRLAAVFAQDQVSPLPPPATPAPIDPPIGAITGDSHKHLITRLDTLATEIGYAVEHGRTRGDGYCDLKARRIVINDELDANAQVAVRIHELAHALADLNHHDQDPALSYADGELIAESVAYSCCRAVGLATDENSIPYLASWAEQTELDILERAATLTDRLATRIEAALNTGNDDEPQREQA